MSFCRTARYWALMFCLSAGPSGSALACGYDGQTNNPFVQAYPGSLTLAMNTQRAIQDGTLVSLPVLSGQAGLGRVTVWLWQLRSKLAQAQLPDSFSLYLIDSALWTRFEAAGGKVLVQSHRIPGDGEPVLLTSEATLAALLRGDISLAQARQQGLLSWSEGVGESPMKVAVDTALTSS